MWNVEVNDKSHKTHQSKYEWKRSGALAKWTPNSLVLDYKEDDIQRNNEHKAKNIYQ